MAPTFRDLLKVIPIAACVVVLLIYSFNFVDLSKYSFKEQIVWEINVCDMLNGSDVGVPTIRKAGEGLLKDVSEVEVADESIFFHETSCSEDLNSRQSCAVESAARANPRTQVYVLFSSPTAKLGPDGGRNIRMLRSSYPNVHFYHLNLLSYTKGSRLEAWLLDGGLAKSSFRVVHLSDGLRYLTLWKYGGIYLDLDVVVMTTLEGMKNFAGDEVEGTIANGLMSLSRRGMLVNACLDEFVDSYRGDLWRHNGPDVLERALRKTCKLRTRNVWSDCAGGFVIYPPPVFYPIKWQEWDLYFRETASNATMERLNDSIAVHVWNKLSAKAKVRVGSTQPYGLIASKYCPLAYGNSGPLF